MAQTVAIYCPAGGCSFNPGIEGTIVGFSASLSVAGVCTIAVGLDSSSIVPVPPVQVFSGTPVIAPVFQGYFEAGNVPFIPLKTPLKRNTAVYSNGAEVTLIIERK